MDRKKTCNEGDHGFYERCRDYVHKLFWILNSNSLIRVLSFFFLFVVNFVIH